MCTGGRLIADFAAGTGERPDLPAGLEQHLTATTDGLWVVWAYKLARPAGDLFAPLTGGAGYPADAVAACRRRLGHDAPDPGCTCGFHALSDHVARDQVGLGMGAGRWGRGVVALSVALSGRVLAFEWPGGGVLWRAGRQTVARVERPAWPGAADEDIQTRVARIRRTPRLPGDPDGRPAVVLPVAPRDSGPIRLALPVSAPLLPVCHDDAGWCTLASTSRNEARSLALV